jgi:hypothetical protein
MRRWIYGSEPGFFGVDDRRRRPSDLSDQLEAFGRAVDFEIFVPISMLPFATGRARRAAGRRSIPS